MPKTCDNVTIERVESSAQSGAVSSSTLLGKKQLNFEKFIPKKLTTKKPIPAKMSVGQIVERPYCNKCYVSTLKCQMRKCIRDNGMAFSFHESDEMFAIRRDA